MKTTVLPTDIHSLARTGIDRISDMQWPMSDEQYFSMVRGMLHEFKKVLFSLGRGAGDLLLADFSFVITVGYLSHARLVTKLCKSQGVKLDTGLDSKQFFNPDWRLAASVGMFEFKPTPLIVKFRSLTKDFKFNDHLGFANRVFGSCANVVGVGSFSKLKGKYAQERGVRVHNMYMQELVPNASMDCVLPEDISRAVDTIVGSWSEIFAQTHGFELGFEDQAARCWKERLRKLYMLREHVALMPMATGEVWVTETARPMHRAVAAAFRMAGGKSVGFHHGNSMGGMLADTHSYHDTAAFDMYCCPTDGCSDAYAESFESSGLRRFANVDILSLRSGHYKRLQQSMSSREFSKKINTVMLLGFPMNATRYYGVPANFFLYQIKLELRILQLLRQEGYTTLYKIHPERQKGITDLIKPFCDMIVPEPFENCWDKADALIIKYSSSTTFGHALCTNRPIIFFDHERPYWRADHYALLERRCRMVPAQMGTDGVDFDESAFLAALRQKPQEPDYAYVRELMYPVAE